MMVDPKKVEARLMAPCCWQESVLVHRSEAAAQMRAEIARMAADGRSEDQIVDHYIAQYGERILQEPRGNRMAFLTLFPLVVIALATMLLIRFLRRQHLQARAAQ